MTEPENHTENPARSGLEILHEAVRSLPASSGVYRMLDAKGDALYIGKARRLKERVSSYTQIDALPPRLQRMVMQIARLEVTLTGSEAEALLLEANFIKQLRPRYNILLKDDKSFPYIFISDEHPYPQIRKHRGAQNEKGKYYGPFASVQAVNETITFLQRAFLLRPCADTVFRNRTRPCLQYQIKRCSAPCVNYIPQAEYGELVQEAHAFLSGNSRQIQERLTSQMEEASRLQNYEHAAMIRDRIRALTRVQQEHKIHAPALGFADVIALHREGEVSCLQIFFFRAGQNYGNRAYFPSHAADATEGEILAAFMGQFYQRQEPPREIMVSHLPQDAQVLESALALRAGHKVSLTLPKRGGKMEALAYALNNARESLRMKQAENASQRRLLEKLAELFGLEAPPERIEVYDNSHVMGTHAVGAMIVAGPEGFRKNAYRTFNMRNTETVAGDDYGMLREMLTRRFKRMEDETSGRPDLVLIDGGAGQLSTALSVMEEMGIADIPLAAIAKGPDRNAGREQFFVPGREPFRLPPGDAALHYLQRLRDEAHRFAIGSHRRKRSSSLTRSELDGVPGIGPTRKKALLRHFGSAREVANSTLDELKNVQGINAATAEKIFRYFQER